MAVSVSFAGTYTENDGQGYAAGTVAITLRGGSTTTATLDASGHYSTSIAAEGVFAVVETLTGVAAHTKTVYAVNGAVVDTGHDIGTVIGGPGGSAVVSVNGQTGAVDLSGTYVQEFDIARFASLQAAVAAAAATGAGGKVLITRDTTVTGVIDANKTFGVVIEGNGKRGHKLTFSYAGASDIISAKSSIGFTLRKLNVVVSSTAASGYFLNVDHDNTEGGPILPETGAPIGAGSDSIDTEVDRCRFRVAAGSSLKAWVHTQASVYGVIYFNSFNGGRRAIDSGVDGYSNDWSIIRNSFNNSILRPIHLGASVQSWTIEKNLFESLADGSSGSIDICQAPGATAFAYTVHYGPNWHGDSVGGTWAKVGGTLGSSFDGNYFGSGAHAIEFTMASQGMSVCNNRGDAGDIDFGNSGTFVHLGLEVDANDITLVRLAGHRWGNVGDSVSQVGKLLDASGGPLASGASFGVTITFAPPFFPSAPVVTATAEGAGDGECSVWIFNVISTSFDYKVKNLDAGAQSVHLHWRAAMPT